MSGNSLLPVLCALFALVTVCSGSKKRYDGYHVVAVHAPSDSQRTILQEYLTQENIDIWDFPHQPGSDVTFSVSPDESDDVISWLEGHGMSASIVISDVQGVIEEEEISAQRMARIGDGTFNFGTYHDHSEMNDFIRSKADGCDICEILPVGDSYEGRDLLVIKIGDHTGGKKGIWIDGGIHAREWVSPAVTLVLIERLVEGYKSGNAEATQLVDSYVWYILPSMNPDGYMYSRTQDRLWRKTRQPNPGSSCVGTDPNRNWDFHWNEVGTSDNPCSQIYAGPHAFSEPETQQVADFILTIADDLTVYLTLHSYGQYFLTPWGYGPEVPSDYDELMEVGQAAVDRITEVSGRRYTLGSSTNVLYAAAGASDDWAKGVAHIKYVYTVELRDTGNYGFLLPEQGIRPTAREIWNAIVAMTSAMA